MTTPSSGSPRPSASRRPTSPRSRARDRRHARRRRRRLRDALALVGRPQAGRSGARCGTSAACIGDAGRRACWSTASACPARAGFPTRGSTSPRTCWRRRADDDGDALVFWGEDKVARRMSHASCTTRVVARRGRRCAAHGIAAGRPRRRLPAEHARGDRRRCWAPPRVGAIWSSCSPDFGVQGVLDRFGQIEPRVLFTVDGYCYNGKARADRSTRSREIVARLPTRRARGRRALPRARAAALGDLPACATRVPWDDFARAASPRGPIDYARLPFDHPLYILYSSGTTGVPKCIVHGAGGTLLQHLKEHLLHGDVKPGDRLFYFTTCGWMMWNWLVSGSPRGATLLLYDGSPFVDRGRILWDLADAEQHDALRHLGQVHRRASKKIALVPRKDYTLAQRAHDALDRLPAGARELRLRLPVREARRAACRRSPAAPTSSPASRWAIPTLPVWRGELQCRGLGHGRRGVRRATASPCAAREGRARVHVAVPVDAGAASGTIRTAPSTAPPTSSAFPASGATATGPSSPSTTASSSTAARTRRSIRAACASAPPRSTARSSSCARWWRAWSSARTGRPAR